MTTTKAEVGRELGAVINDLMYRARISHTAMARVIGVGQSTMSKKLRGETVITVVELMQIAEVLDKDPGELLCACRDSNPKPSDLVLGVPRCLSCGEALRTEGGWTCVNPRCPSPRLVNLGFAVDRRSSHLMTGWVLAA